MQITAAYNCQTNLFRALACVEFRFEKIQLSCFYHNGFFRSKRFSAHSASDVISCRLLYIKNKNHPTQNLLQTEPFPFSALSCTLHTHTISLWSHYFDGINSSALYLAFLRLSLVLWYMAQNMST